jgi:hypothetical protein
MTTKIEEEGRITKLIPYRNPKALIGYYLGFVGLIPIAGFPFGTAAIVLGIMGLQEGYANPDAKGRNHAIVALILGIASVTVCLDAGLVLFVLIKLAGFLGSFRMQSSPQAS